MLFIPNEVCAQVRRSSTPNMQCTVFYVQKFTAKDFPSLIKRGLWLNPKEGRIKMIVHNLLLINVV
jgi:hypothetical protein